MRKIILFLTIVILMLIFAVFKFSNNFVFDMSRKAALAFQKKDYIQGIDIQNIDFENARWQPEKSLIWENITSEISLKNKKSFLPGRHFTIHIEQLELKLKHLLNQEFSVTARGLTVQPGQQLKMDSENITPTLRKVIENGRININFTLNYFKPTTLPHQMRRLFQKMTHIIHQGSTPIPINFACTSYFIINGNPVRAMITTKKNSEGYYYLAVNREFFKSIAWLMADDITDAEATLLSAHPFRVPELLNIMNDARNESQRYKDDKSIPEDAYRHVLWSYLLTIKYGPEFAKAVTDAHEEGDDTNTNAEHRMDYQNNAVGREYAANRYKRTEILSYLLQDPQVVREAW